jgi:RNA polymerase sigma-70 factor (ECF subfamily)
VGFEHLLARARTGDEAAWAALYDSLAPQVLGYLRARGAVDAEEVLGDVFLHIARGIDDFDGDAAGFRSWVFVIATSRLFDERRRLRRKPTTSLEPATEERMSSPVDVELEVEQASVAEEIQALLAVLTPEQRTVVELRVFGGLTSQEVADTVGKPLGAVKALYRRGLGALRRQIEGVGVPADLRPAAPRPPVPVASGKIIPFPTAAVPLRAHAAVTRGS